MTCEAFEVFLSGYLDEELTQQERQKVSLHLEACAQCQQMLVLLQKARQAAQAMDIQSPTKEEWGLMQSRILENTSRGVGWIILVVWSVFTVGYGLFHYAVSPTEPLIEKILIFGIFLGFALLFLSVLLQRLREHKTDRYRGVLK